ncbi:TIGR00730 family Rossman fold protein [Spartinivicinus poritis]|uniref:Cytokinin riboside 5'-monophosphate phosphoribohydrolase n=1 Tax=Spartinivicinus poritis TaxID=2994640 RepID=A0ABT5UBE2_9GAMM|nr:TIGR00730 family Rossman fold protein [Spartinivicinus sp. A2-2]MDE1463500.1 TIGR00730 family Rossman fold protein [Spartinivicinus sp. A2-2]
MRVNIFCASRPGLDPSLPTMVQQLAIALIKNKIGVVYGGANDGLMGILADHVLALKGEVIGVMPSLLVARERAHAGLTEWFEVSSLATRKEKMASLADCFLVLPGGLGTLDELFEVLTWAQVGLHNKPIAILNHHGYYNHLLAFLEEGVANQLIAEKDFNRLLIADTPVEIVEKLIESVVFD